MIPMIEREIVEKRQWITRDEISDIFAVSESIPGAIAINAATFIGFRIAGIGGAIVAMAGVLLPTFFIVILLSIFFLNVQDQPKIEAAFIAIRATIVALITYAAITIGKTAILDKATVALVAVTVVVMFFLNIHPVLLIVGGAMAGIVIIYMKRKLGMSIKLEHEQKEKDETKYKYDDYYIGHGI